MDRRRFLQLAAMAGLGTVAFTCPMAEPEPDPEEAGDAP